MHRTTSSLLKIISLKSEETAQQTSRNPTRSRYLRLNLQRLA